MRVFNLMNLFIFSMVAMMSPDDSWVAKWQRISKLSIVVVFATTLIGRPSYKINASPSGNFW